jgi:hypothetical protein
MRRWLTVIGMLLAGCGSDDGGEGSGSRAAAKPVVDEECVRLWNEGNSRPGVAAMLSESGGGTDSLNPDPQDRTLKVVGASVGRVADYSHLCLVTIVFDYGSGFLRGHQYRKDVNTNPQIPWESRAGLSPSELPDNVKVFNVRVDSEGRLVGADLQADAPAADVSDQNAGATSAPESCGAVTFAAGEGEGRVEVTIEEGGLDCARAKAIASRAFGEDFEPLSNGDRQVDDFRCAFPGDGTARCSDDAGNVIAASG